MGPTLTSTDRELLSRIKVRSAEIVRSYRRSIKHRPHIRAFDPQEQTMITELIAIEKSASALLDTTYTTNPKGTGP